MNTTMKAVNEALEQQKPEIAAEYAAFARRQLDFLVERFGPELKGIYNSYQAGAFRAISPVVVATKSAPVTNKTLEHGIDEAKLAAWSDAQADAAVAAWLTKITDKLEGCTDIEVISNTADMTRFTITAKLGEHKVALEQTRTINCSPKGRLFHQFPARIYVDGRFTPEAKFKKLAR